MFKIEKFFGYFDLEKSLVVFSWYGIIGGVVGVFLEIAAFAFIQFANCNAEPVQGFFKYYQLKIENCESYMTIATYSSIALFISTFINIIVSYLFVRGVKTRNHRLITPLEVFIVISTFIAFLIVFPLIKIFPHSAISAFVSLAFFIYFYLCIHTVSENIRDEKPNNVQL